MLRRTLLPVLALLLCSISACTSPAEPSTEAHAPGLGPTRTSFSALTASPTPVGYRVTGDADGAPLGCSPQDIAQRAAAMVDAINQGDVHVVDEYFGKQRNAPFQWYSMTEGGIEEANQHHFVAYTLDDLTAYLKRRYTQHEHMQLHQIQFNGWEAERGIVHFGPIELTRRADDLPPGLGGPTGQVHGKGAYHCATHAFIVLSLGMGKE